MASSAPAPAALITHRGACHCRDIEFEFTGERDLVAIDCNCSICAMKKNTHVIVPQTRFRLLKGDDALATYTFNTHRAKHMFCKRCGVQPFYIPRSNQDGYAITVACIDPGTVSTVTVDRFDGQNWEQTFAQSDISKYSKE